MKLETLLQSVEILEIRGSSDVEIEGIACDSRQVVPNGVFIAIPGHRMDGSHYVGDALANGAAAVVSENDLETGVAAVHVRVESARRAAAELANAFYGNLSREMKVVGVTGTNGKTTTVYMIRDLLRDAGWKPGLIGTVAYEIGDRTLPAVRTTPEAPDIHSMFSRMRSAGCDSVVMEVSSHAIALQRVHGIDFDISVFTNLSRDHLDYHKTMEDYFNVKSELFSGLGREDGHAYVINMDDPWVSRLLNGKEPAPDAITFGFDERAMVRASDVEIGPDGTAFQVSTPWGDTRINLNLPGRFNIGNALAAMAVGGLCGLDPGRMAESMEKLHSIPGRLEAIPNRKHKKIFVDYAHTDDALRNVLEALREICAGRLIVVFGCGGNRDRGKRQLMGEAAAALADFSIITSDNPRSEDPGAIAGDIIKGFSDEDTFAVELDRRTAIERGIKETGRRDILLVAGKGHETYQELKDTIVPFDDREVVREILG